MLRLWCLCIFLGFDTAVLLTVFTAAGVAGVVEQIGIFTNQMKTGNNREITITNSQIYGGVIINASAKQTRRIDFVIGVGYGDNLQKVEPLLLECITYD